MNTNCSRRRRKCGELGITTQMLHFKEYPGNVVKYCVLGRSIAPQVCDIMWSCDASIYS